MVGNFLGGYALWRIAIVQGYHAVAGFAVMNVGGGAHRNLMCLFRNIGPWRLFLRVRVGVKRVIDRPLFRVFRP